MKKPTLEEIRKIEQELMNPFQPTPLKKITIPDPHEGWIYVPSIEMEFAPGISYKGLGWFETHKEIIPKGYVMPTPRQLWELVFHLKENLDRPNYSRVLDSILKKAPDSVSSWRAEWLNAFFSWKPNKMCIQNINDVKKGQVLLNDKGELKPYLVGDCRRVNISSKAYISEEGLATLSANENEDYKMGENIQYWGPRDNCVAKLLVCGKSADLACHQIAPYAGDSHTGVRLARYTGGKK